MLLLLGRSSEVSFSLKIKSINDDTKKIGEKAEELNTYLANVGKTALRVHNKTCKINMSAFL